jgi:myo-inositol-1(or 4)-monophosphatase
MPSTLHEDDLSAYLQTAAEFAQIAGETAAGYFRHIDARRKADGSLVTVADETVDRLLCDALQQRYPDHAVLSEEQSTIYDPDDDFTWVVDPIDGTTNFARGMIFWGISIGLLYRGEPVVGVIHMPLLHETYTGALGQGAALNGAPIYSARETKPTDQHLMTLCTRTSRERTIETPLKSRMLGSAAYHLMQVAQGAALADVEATPKIWDIAAGAVILSEAGALLTLQDGSEGFPLPAVRQNYAQHQFPILAAANSPIQQLMLTALTSARGVA